MHALSTDWLKYINETFSGTELKWILTEGNVSCDNDNCTNGKYYYNWLKELSNYNTCAGYTIWNLTNSVNYKNSAICCGDGTGIIPMKFSKKMLTNFSNVYPINNLKKCNSYADSNCFYKQFPTR